MANTATDREREMRVAVERVVGFAQEFGEAHLNIACHAAFPLSLTPDLLYQIWANFVPEAPWTAVARVLLSRVCKQVGAEMYEMDNAVRNLLLRQLKVQFGQKRFDSLGQFLLEYVSQKLTEDDPDTQDLRQAQEWTVLAYTKPEQAARELEQVLSSKVQHENIGEVLRLSSLVEALSEPLEEAGFKPLLIYVQKIKSDVYGKLETAKPHAGFDTKIISQYKPWNLQKTIDNNQGKVNAIAFSPDGKMIASAGDDGTICLWDLEGQLIATWGAHQYKVWSLAFSTDGKFLVTGNEDGKICFWEVKNTHLIKTLNFSYQIYSVALSPDMRFVAVAGKSYIIELLNEFNLDRNFPVKFGIKGHTNNINCVTFSFDRKLLASCSDDLTIKLWDFSNDFKLGTSIRTLQGHKGQVKAIAFHPNGKSLVSASSDLSLRLWDIEGTCIKVFEGHTDSISSVAFHPSGEMIASGGEDGTVRLWNLQGDCLDLLSNENQTNVRTVAFNFQGTILAYGGQGQPIYLYSQETIGRELQSCTFDVATIEIEETDTKIFEFTVATLESKFVSSSPSIDVEDLLELVNTLLGSDPLNSLEEEVFRECLEDRIYEHIALRLRYSKGYISKVGARIFKRLSQVLGTTVIKDNVSLILREHFPTNQVQWVINREQRQAEGIIEVLEEGIELQLMLIPSGTFYMGAPETEADSDSGERPQHKVTVPSFYMGRFPVTQAQWKAVAEREDLKVNIDLNPDPSMFKELYETYSRWDRPVENVSWYEAKEFCARLSKLTGKQYRLPTEAEWEYACRSVISDRLSMNSEELTVEEWNEQYNQPFHFGETISIELANYNGNYTYGHGVKGEYREQTTPVGYFGVANAFGLYDMHGNVWEWCEDDWHDKYDGAPTDGSAWLAGDKNAAKILRGAAKILRGGSWIFDPNGCRSAFRYNYIPDFRFSSFGFRVVGLESRTF